MVNPEHRVLLGVEPSSLTTPPGRLEVLSADIDSVGVIEVVRASRSSTAYRLSYGVKAATGTVQSAYGAHQSTDRRIRSVKHSTISRPLYVIT